MGEEHYQNIHDSSHILHTLNLLIIVNPSDSMDGKQCWKFPQVRHSQAHNFGGVPGTISLFFFNFYVYDLRFKAWGPTTFLTEFQTLMVSANLVNIMPIDVASPVTI